MDNYPPGVYAYTRNAPWNEPNPPECMNVKCCATLDDDWLYCPYCGEPIDWEAVEYRKEVH